MKRRIQWIALVLLLPVLMGCGKEIERRSADLALGEMRWGSFPVPIRVDAYLLSEPSGTADLRDAMDFWEYKAGRQLFVLEGAWDSSQPPYAGPVNSPSRLLGNVILLQGPWPFDPRVAGKTILHSSNGTIEHSIILLNAETHLCAADCLGQDGSVSRRRLLAHELGHLLGLGHASSKNDIMYPEILPGGSLAAMEINESMLYELTR
jgi:hypothetical protein